jgi:hypothetical protein
MTDFFRFPHTPHLAWLGPGVPRDDKVLAPAEAQALLAGEVVVEETPGLRLRGFPRPAAATSWSTWWPAAMRWC